MFSKLIKESAGYGKLLGKFKIYDKSNSTMDEIKLYYSSSNNNFQIVGNAGVIKTIDAADYDNRLEALEDAENNMKNEIGRGGGSYSAGDDIFNSSYYKLKEKFEDEATTPDAPEENDPEQKSEPEQKPEPNTQPQQNSETTKKKKFDKSKLKTFQVFISENELAQVKEFIKEISIADYIDSYSLIPKETAKQSIKSRLRKVLARNVYAEDVLTQEEQQALSETLTQDEQPNAPTQTNFQEAITYYYPNESSDFKFKALKEMCETFSVNFDETQAKQWLNVGTTSNGKVVSPAMLNQYISHSDSKLTNEQVLELTQKMYQHYGLVYNGQSPHDGPFESINHETRQEIKTIYDNFKQEIKKKYKKEKNKIQPVEETQQPIENEQPVQNEEVPQPKMYQLRVHYYEDNKSGVDFIEEWLQNNFNWLVEYNPNLA